MNNYESLSKFISYILRQAPSKYKLKLDEEDWVNVDPLLAVLRAEKLQWATLNQLDLSEMIQQSTKKRHELSDKQ